MALNDRLRAYYQDHPQMISSPFGGIDGVNHTLLMQVWKTLGVNVAGKTVLDAGCGRGYVAEVIEDQGGQYTGIDLVPSRAGFRFALAEAGRLPFADESFDAVFCIDVFEHVADPRRAAREFRRVIRPDGFVFLSVPNYANVAGLVKWYCERFGGYAKHTWAPFRQWHAQELEHPITGGQVRRAFRAAGFTRFRRIGHGAEIGLGVCPWLAHPRLPEALAVRLQWAFGVFGPATAHVAPGLSLHGFWKIER